MDHSATVTNSVAGQLRYLVLIVWVVICVVFGWVGISDQNILPRLFFGLFSLIGAAFLLFLLHEESALATTHSVATAEVVSYRRGRAHGRGHEMRYRFVAADRRSYEQSSSVFSLREFKKGERILILYNPLRPVVNKPLAGFIFYRFEIPS